MARRTDGRSLRLFNMVTMVREVIAGSELIWRRLEMDRGRGDPGERRQRGDEDRYLLIAAGVGGMAVGHGVDRSLDGLRAWRRPGVAARRGVTMTGGDWREDGGAERNRTADLLIANETLSQLSYSPTFFRRKPRPGDCWVPQNAAG